MKTWAALATAALVLSGCGGSDSGGDTSSVPTASATPDGLGMAAGCAQVQMATDEIGGSGALGSWSQPTYQEYGAELAEIADEAQSDAGRLITALAEQSTAVAAADIDDESVPLDELISEWANRYVELQQACALADSPIRRLT